MGGWDLWRLREVGAWGDLGRRIGARWEEVGGAALPSLFGGRVVGLWSDRALGKWLGTLGLPNPDALLVEDGADGRVTLRPIDLKWSIDTAEYTQIAGERLRHLHERAGDRLAALLPSDAEPRFGDGLFVAPERPLNRLFLGSRANLRREYPIEEREIRFVPVDLPSFFGPLPGWAIARRLAELEGAEWLERDLEVADRYYHLGVGVWGALAAADRSIFAAREGIADDDLLEVDPEVDRAVVRRLDELIAFTGARRARDLVAHLARAQAERGVLRQERRALERLPYRFADYLADARKAGLRTQDEVSVQQLRDLYRELGKTHATELRARGRELVAAGRTDAEALAELRVRQPEIEATLRRRARDLLRHLP
ncbi:MAG TPA: hypothetical protein VGM69_22765 [Chloroflexota bacterium]